jgi:hypothetical protein
MYSISRYIKTKSTGIYVIKPEGKYFPYMNYFFIRPVKKNNQEFDKIFTNKLKRY